MHSIHFNIKKSLSAKGFGCYNILCPVERVTVLWFFVCVVHGILLNIIGCDFLQCANTPSFNLLFLDFVWVLAWNILVQTEMMELKNKWPNGDALDCTKIGGQQERILFSLKSDKFSWEYWNRDVYGVRNSLLISLNGLYNSFRNCNVKDPRLISVGLCCLNKAHSSRIST